jgi:hypothetical protein
MRGLHGDRLGLRDTSLDALEGHLFLRLRRSRRALWYLQ